MLGGDKGMLVPLEVLDVLECKDAWACTHPLSSGCGWWWWGGCEKWRRRSGIQTATGGEGEEGGKDRKKGEGGRWSAVHRPADIKAQAGARVGVKSISEQEGEINEYGERRNLMEICSFVNTTFKEAGFLKDTRPLKPSRRTPLCHTDIWESRDAMRVLGTGDADVQVLQPADISSSVSLGETSAAALA
ncbi:hypothetical protein CVT25_002833 [Psilocybe cyanescens]|uniref:Uncharacterized protein n=1 Tax=Psilocybe cyanescens TaxID=93625 RepID=A0A409WL87_PSICY|nr:hypothetical protein CVT25_002833 [Psilocybe cyanescens]